MFRFVSPVLMIFVEILELQDPTRKLDLVLAVRVVAVPATGTGRKLKWRINNGSLSFHFCEGFSLGLCGTKKEMEWGNLRGRVT